MDLPFLKEKASASWFLLFLSKIAGSFNLDDTTFTSLVVFQTFCSMFTRKKMGEMRNKQANLTIGCIFFFRWVVKQPPTTLTETNISPLKIPMVGIIRGFCCSFQIVSDQMVKFGL